MIEPADEAQAAALADLHARAFDRGWSQPDIAKLLQNPTTFALISRAETAQGFVLAWSAGGDSEILTVAVVPPKRAGAASAQPLSPPLALSR
jgi:ribosomal-protein-alanine N-acetyltransferase